MELFRKSGRELSAMMLKREISVEDLLRAHLCRIEQIENKVKAFITITEERALKLARELDRQLASGAMDDRLSDLWGIPIGLKDNLLTRGIRTTSGSKMLAEYFPPYDATVVERLTRGGTILMGKTNLDEFAMGSSTENSAFYPTRNPWDLTRVPGGSSGGSAAAVAAGEVVLALGSDTGGSIRQPAAFCGIVGLKPTYGSVSRYGLIAFASSMDQIGPLTRDVTDSALVLNQLIGYDPRDSTSVRRGTEDFTQALITDVKDIKLGVPQEYFEQNIHPEISQLTYKAIRILEKLGAQVEEVSLPHTEMALPTYYILAPAEASSNLSRFDGIRFGKRAHEVTDLNDLYSLTRSEGFGSEVKRRIMLGTYTLSVGYYDQYYRKAQKVRTLIIEDFARVFANFDVLISPTTPTTAFKLQENLQNPLAMYKSDILTVPANLAGIPAISIPIGFDSTGLPIGLQILGKHFAEATLLRVAYTLEQELGLLAKKDWGITR